MKFLNFMVTPKQVENKDFRFPLAFVPEKLTGIIQFSKKTEN